MLKAKRGKVNIMSCYLNKKVSDINIYKLDISNYKSLRKFTLGADVILYGRKLDKRPCCSYVLRRAATAKKAPIK